MRAALLICIVALALVATLAARHVGDAGAARAGPAAATRASGFVACPSAGLVPHGLALDDSVLRNLGGGVMGSSRTFRDRGRSVSVHVGFDILDRLDDLDFRERPGVGPRGLKVFDSRVLEQRLPLRAATWRAAAGPARCRSVTVVASGLGESAFRRLLDAQAAARARPDGGG